MKFCNKCHRATAGKPTFCNFCGGSYDVRLCPRHHINPRSAVACSQCGNRDLSEPQPKIPLLLRPLFALTGVMPGLVLLALIVGFLWFYIRQLINDPTGLLPLMCIGLALALLFTGWIMLPNFLKRFLKRISPFSSKDRDTKNE